MFCLYHLTLRLLISEMGMLRMICCLTLRYCIINETIHEMTDVGKILEFLRERRLQWFGHVEKMNDEKAPVKAKHFVVNGTKRAD